MLPSIFLLGGDFIKIRKVLVCFLVVLLCINGFVFSVSAYNSDDVIFTFDNGVSVLDFEKTDFTKGYTSNDFVSTLSASLGYDINDYYYYFDIGFYSGGWFMADIALFDKSSGLKDNTLFIASDGNVRNSTNIPVFSSQSEFRIKNNALVFRKSNNTFSFRTTYSFNGTVGLITNIPKISYNGNTVMSDLFVNYDMSVSDDYIATLSAVTNSETDLNYHISIYNQSSQEPSEVTHIPYAPADTFVQHINANSSGSFQFDLQDFRDKCFDMKTFSEKIIISCWCMGENDYYNEKFFYLDINDPFTDDNPKKALFAEKKDYKAFPELEGYLYSEDFPDIRDYVDFTMFDEADSIGDYIVAIFQFLWSCLTGFFKWLWAVLKYIFFNFVGLFRWLGACMWTIIENIGIALYNLVVDLRRLVLYLFVPPSDELHYVIKDKFPALARVQSYITAGKNGTQAETTINLWGNEIDFNFGNIPKDLKTYLYSGSTICLYVIQIYVIIRCFFKMFGVQFGSSGGADD